ncbi:MAG TPA: hypothetical protein VFG69_09600 [Nannocystaceae bacterium]|nr:hypothetical protein [Nannocystaceae bacterium]
MNLRLGLGSAVLGIVLGGCRGEDISFDCENQRQRLNDRADEEEQALVDVPAKGPYPVGVQISADGINRLLASVIDEDVPFAGSVPFGILPQGPADAAFQPTSAPVIEFAATPGCRNCVLFHLDFGVQLTSEGLPLSAGAGFVDLEVPLVLESDEATGTSTLVAKYGDAQIGPWKLVVFGFDSDQHEVLAGALKILLQEEIQTNYGDVELLELGSWQIGQGDVRLLARELFVTPDADPTDDVDDGKIVLAMHTNLALPPGIGLDLSQPLPPASVMLVSMDPRLLLAMAHRMLAEGEIARFYNEDGEPDPEGIYGVSLEDIAPSPQLDDTLDSDFDVWRVADGYCGFAKVIMPLRLGVDMAFQHLTVEAGDAVPVGGEGSPAQAKEEKKLVDENQHLIDQFREDLAAQLENTINYEALVLEDSDIAFINQGVLVSPTELTSFLDFVVLARE